MLYVISIGIDHYHDNAISTLKHACDDAKSFGKLFEEGIDSGETQVQYLLNKDATKNAIMSAIGNRLPRKANDAEDIVILYFAGHGSPETNGSLDNTSRYLVAHDTPYGEIYPEGIDLQRDLQRLYERISNPRLLIMFIDSCFSGRAGGRTFEGPLLKIAKASERGRNLRVQLRDLDLGEGRIMISACDDDQVARESSKLGHGYFTYALLETLTDTSQKTKTIGIGTLYDSLSKKVCLLSDGDQSPIMNGRNRGASLPIIPKNK